MMGTEGADGSEKAEWGLFVPAQPDMGTQRSMTF